MQEVKGFAVHYATDGTWTGDSFATASEAKRFVRAMNERRHWRYREPLTIEPIIERNHWPQFAAA